VHRAGYLLIAALAVLGGGPTVEITGDRLTLSGPFGAGLSYRDNAG
jgi:hypothetical protein